MKAKFVFLDDLEAAVGFTSQLFTQGFVGTTTIVPQVSFWDYFWVSSVVHVGTIVPVVFSRHGYSHALLFVANSSLPIRSFRNYTATFRPDPWQLMNTLP